MELDVNSQSEEETIQALPVTNPETPEPAGLDALEGANVKIVAGGTQEPLPRITEEQAFQALEFAKNPDQLDEQQTARLRSVLTDYTNQQKEAGETLFPQYEAQRVEEAKQVKKIFTDPKHGFDDAGFDEFNQQYVNDEEGKAAYLNSQFLGSITDKDPADIRRAQGVERDLYSAETWGKTFETEKEFFERAKADVEIEEQIGEWTQSASLRGMNLMEAMSAMPEHLRESEAFQDRKGDWGELMDETHRNTTARIDPYRTQIDEVSETLNRKTGVAEGEAPESFTDLAELLLGVPDSDLNLVIASIIDTAKGDDNEAFEPEQRETGLAEDLAKDAMKLALPRGKEKTTAQKLAENFGRGARDLGMDSLAFSERDLLQQMRAEIYGGLKPVEGQAGQEFISELRGEILDSGAVIGSGFASSFGKEFDGSQLDDAQREALAEIDKRVKILNINKRLREISDQEIDPAKGEYLMTNGVYSATRSLPYMAASITGAPGFMITSLALAEDSYQTLKRNNPEMTDKQAFEVASISGPIQGSLERISGKLLTGKLPFVETYLNKAIATTGGAVARATTRVGAATGIEISQETGQDFTPNIIQGTISAMSQDMPNVAWSDRYGDAIDQFPELFFATLPIAVIAGGAGTYRDVKGARELLADYDSLRFLGMSEADASKTREFAMAGKMDEAQSLLRESITKEGKATQDINKTRREIQLKAFDEKQIRENLMADAEEIGLLPGIRRTSEGYTLHYEGGSVSDPMTYEEASKSRFRFAKDNNISLHASTRAVMQQVESQMEEGREIKFVFNPFNKSVREAEQAGEVSTEAAGNRVDIAEQQNRPEPSPEFDNRGRELPDQSDEFSGNTLFPNTGEDVPAGNTNKPGDFIGQLEGVDGIETVTSGDKFAGTQEFFGVNKTADPKLWPKVKAAIDKGDLEGAKKLAWDGLKSKAASDGFRGTNTTTDEILVGLHHHRGSTGGSVVLREFTGLDSSATVPELIKAFEAKVSKGNFAADWVKARETQENEFHGARPKFRKGLSNRWGKEAEFLAGDGVNVDPELVSEYNRGVTSSNMAAASQEDRLASQIILGSNATEYQDGIAKTTIRLYQNASPLTIVEEKVEADIDGMIRTGRRDWIVSALREFEAVSGTSLFLNGKADTELTNTDIKEAWSDLATSYFVDRTREGDSKISKKLGGFYEVADQIMSTKLAGAFTAYGEFFRSVWKRAATINKLRREGTLDADLEKELARQVGFGEQQEYNQGVIAKAEEFIQESDFKDVEFTPTDDAPFSTIRRDGASLNELSEIRDNLAQEFDQPDLQLKVNESGEVEVSQVEDQAKAEEIQEAAQSSINESPVNSSARSESGRVVEQPGETSFSTIANPEQVIAEMFSPFQRAPEMRIKMAAEMQKRSADIGAKFAAAIARNRTKKDVETERKDRQADLLSDKMESLTDIEAQLIDDIDSLSPLLTSIKSQGGIIPKSKAGKNSLPEYDGSEGAPRNVFNSAEGLAPDQVAQANGYDDVNQFWQAVIRESESAKRYAEQKKEVDQKIKDFKAEAKAESEAWAKEANRAGNDRQVLVAALQTLDAITGALPFELRGRVNKGFVHLAQLKTGDAMLDEIDKRVKQLDKHIERYLKKEADEAIKKLFKRIKKSRQSKAGKVSKGKNSPELYELFDTLKDAMALSGIEGQTRADSIQALLDDGEIADDMVAVKQLEVSLLPLFSGWKETGSAERTAALEESTRIWKSGYADWKIQQAEIRERRENSQAALVAGTNKKGTGPEKDLAQIFDTTLRGKAKAAALNLINFDQLITKTFGDNETSRWFANRERGAANQKQDAVQEFVEGVEDLFTRLGGGNRLKGEKIQFRLSSKKSILAIDSLGGARQLTQMEGLTAILMWRQEDGKRHMRGKKDENGKLISKWGYDQNFIDQVSDQLEPEAWQVLDYLTEQYEAEYEGLNPVFKRLNGVNLPKTLFYSPLTMRPLQAKDDQTVDPTTGTTTGNTFVPGSLRSRGTAIAEPEFRDAIATYISHKKQIEHWKAYAEFGREAQAVLGNRDVGNAAEASQGVEATTLIRKWLDAFAQGGVRDAQAGTAYQNFFRRMIGNAQSMALVGRAGTLAIQATQLGAAAAKMPTGAYINRLGKLAAGQLSYGEALNSEYIQRRMKEQPILIQQAMEGLKAGSPTLVKYAARHLGSLIGGTDALATAGTYAIVYDYQKSQALKNGATEQEAAEIATTETERILDQVAQPTRMGSRSFAEVSTTNPLGKLAWAFGSESRKNLALMLSAEGGVELGRAALYVVLINGLMASVIRTAWRDARDDDEENDEKLWNVERMALATFTDWMFGFPVIGEEVQRGIYSAFGVYQPDGGLVDGISRSPQAIENLFIDKDSEDILRDVETLLAGGGLFSQNASALTSGMHILRDVTGLLKNFFGQ